jgi:hypothetical protein
MTETDHPDGQGNIYGAESTMHFIGRSLGASMQTMAAIGALRAIQGKSIMPTEQEYASEWTSAKKATPKDSSKKVPEIGDHLPSWEDAAVAGSAPIGSEKAHAMKIAAHDVHQINKNLLSGTASVEGVFDDARSSMRRIFSKDVPEGHEFDTPARDLTTAEMLDRMKKAGDEFHHSVVIAGRSDGNVNAVSFIGNPLVKNAEMAKTDKPFANATKDIAARLDGFLGRAADAKYSDFKPVTGKKDVLASKNHVMTSTEYAPGSLDAKMYARGSDDAHEFSVDGYTVKLAPRTGAPLIGAVADANAAATFRVLRLTPKVGADGKPSVAGGSRVLIAESTMPAVCGNEFATSNHVEQHMSIAIPTPIGDMKGDGVLSDAAGPATAGKRARSTLIACHYRSARDEHDSDSE